MVETLGNELAAGPRDFVCGGHNSIRNSVAVWVGGVEYALDHERARRLGQMLIDQADLVDVENEDDDLDLRDLEL